MIISQKSKQRFVKVISDYIAGSYGSDGMSLPNLSSLLEKDFFKLIPVLEILISDDLISIYSDYNPRKYKTEQKEIERQIKLLNYAFVCSDENFDLLILNDNQSIRISVK